MAFSPQVVRREKANRAKEYYIKNMDQRLAQMRAYYHANRVAILAQQKEYKRGRRNNRATQ